MRALWLLKNGGLDALSVRESNEPAPHDGEVRVRVHAAGLNFAEILIRQGLYPDAPALPAVLGFDAAGVVDAVSPATDGLQPGSRVAVRTHYGSHADYVCASADSVYPLPPAMTFAEAVSFPVTYATAYHALFRTACVRAGDWVLIHAAGGGVGIAAVQLCSTVEGVSVIGTASARKHSLLLQLGCAHAIDYHNQDYRAEVMRITKGRGVDVVLDPLGGSDNVQNYGLLAAEGRLVCYGFLNLVCGERRDVRHVSQQVRRLSSFNVRDLVATSRIVAGLNLTRINDRDARFRKATMQALFKLYEEGKIGPVIAEQYELENAPLGYSRMQRGESTGKIVVIM